MRPMRRYPLGGESRITPNEVPRTATREYEMFEHEIAAAARTSHPGRPARYGAGQ